MIVISFFCPTIIKKLKNLKKAVSVAASLLLLPGTLVASERLNRALNIKPQLEETEVTEANEESSEDQEVAAAPAKKYWICPGCTDTENRVLKALQDYGITDKIALSVLMGNIKQESKFETTICEGGVKTGYHRCHRGGFGLIQWTTTSRYRGLGYTAKRYELDPNSLDAQLKWMFEEREWRDVAHRFKTPGRSISYYMNAAYYWLGWGIHGARTHYAYKYMNYFHFK